MELIMELLKVIYLVFFMLILDNIISILFIISTVLVLSFIGTIIIFLFSKGERESNGQE